MEQNLKYNEINKSPCLTWNWLKMNRGKLDETVTSETSDCAVVSISKSDEENVQVQSWKNSEKASEFENTENSLPEMKSVSSEQSMAVVSSFSSEKILVTAKKSASEPVVINFNLENSKSYASKQIVVAEENAEVTVILDYTSDVAAGGFQAIETKLYAKPYSKIHLVKVQLLGEKFVQVDNTLSYCDDNAVIDVTQIVLGGDKVFANVENVLAGYQSKFKSDTGYIAKNNQYYDINYAVRHLGNKTDTKMSVKGVVGGNATKVYRGTIDFKNGCAGAVGDEQEETLLLSPTAVNKSIPMILCDEEDVSGTHGATLGRLGNEELFYFQSRGISEEQAEQILSRAKIMSIANLIPNSEIVEKIKSYLGEE